MILDYLTRKGQYANVCPGFDQAMEFALSVKDQPVGRYEQGDVFALVQEFDTVPLSQKPFELHQKYLDVHITLSGVEVLEYEDISKLSPAEDYSAERDFQKLDGQGQPVVIKEGMFCVVFPHDGHKPGCCLDQGGKLRKIVLKVPV